MSSFGKLESAYLELPKVKKIDFNRCENLSSPSLASGIEELDLSDCYKLETFHDWFDGVENNELVSLTIKNSNIKYISLEISKSLSSLNISNCDALWEIDISNTNLEKVKIDNCRNLDDLRVSNSKKLKKLELKNLNELSTIDIENTKISSADFSKFTNLYSVSYSYKTTKTIKFSKKPKIIHLEIDTNNKKASVDFSKIIGKGGRVLSIDSGLSYDVKTAKLKVKAKSKRMRTCFIKKGKVTYHIYLK